MAVFALIGHDSPNGLELRKQHRDAHIAGLEALDREGRIIHAGPILGDSGNPTGSVVLFEAPNLDAAKAQVEGDAYIVNGVFESYELYETRVSLPKPK